MYRLLFENSLGQEYEIARGSQNECIQAINDFCNDHLFKIYYMRHWQEDGREKIDVGSHTEFFYLEQIGTSESVNNVESAFGF